jgi:hypothetical protein
LPLLVSWPAVPRLFKRRRLATTVNLLAADNKTPHGLVDTREPVSGPKATKERRIAQLKPDQPISLRYGQHEASCNQGGARAATPLARSGTRLRKTGTNRFTETRLIRAYLDLFFVPPLDDGSKIISLARFGCYEVRLFEPAHDLLAVALPLWIDLYAHDTHSTLDSFGCDDFEAAVTIADDFMARAKALQEESAPGAPSGLPHG